MPIRSFLAAAALGLFLADASAQVDYVRDIAQPNGMSFVLPATQAPYETSSPDYSPTPTPHFFTTAQYYSLDSSTGLVAPGVDFPASVKLGIGSVTSFAGQNTSTQFLYPVGSPPKFFYTYNISAQEVSVVPRLAVNALTSLAARNRDGILLSLIADNQHFTVNRTTGELIAQPLTDVDMSAALYQSYGKDGNLYVLDYANHRMASFDPDNNFAFLPLKSFDLMTGPGIVTANVQFAIGINGSFYLADGLGGGSYYDAAGMFQSTFELPEDAVAAPYTGASYVSTDSAGRVYVFDSATGIHQYQDAAITAVPEPATYAVGIAALLGAVILLRRRRTPSR